MKRWHLAMTAIWKKRRTLSVQRDAAQQDGEKTKKGRIKKYEEFQNMGVPEKQRKLEELQESMDKDVHGGDKNYFKNWYTEDVKDCLHKKESRLRQKNQPKVTSFFKEI
jgi:hypothetical protein